MKCGDRPHWRWVLMVGLLVLVGIGWWVNRQRNADGTLSVTITQAMIDEVLARKFPKEKTYSKVVTVTYLNPRAVMVPGEEKVRVGIEVLVDIRYKGFGKTYRGSASLLTKIGYDPTEAVFFLHESRLEALEIPKIGKDEQGWVREGVNWVAAELVERIPVYRLKKQGGPTDLTRLLLKRLEIKQDRVVATLGL